MIFSFIAGLYIAKLTGAGKGQMLAGGAIVFFYGLVGSFIGLCSSLALSYFTNKKLIVRLNIVLLIGVIALVGMTKYLFDKRQQEKAKKENLHSPEPKKQTTQPFGSGSLNILSLFPTTSIMQKTCKQEIVCEKRNSNQNEMGLSYFAPHLSYSSILQFVNNCNDTESQIIDSIVCYKNSVGQLDIQEAPPWLYPSHLKLDYEILLFKIITNYGAYVENEVNKQNSASFCVPSDQGKIIYWPEFLLNVYSIEAKKVKY